MTLNAKMVFVLLGTYGAGVFSGASLAMATEEPLSSCWEMGEEDPAPWYAAPLRAWRRRDSALEELSHNEWVVATDPSFAQAADQKRVGHVSAAFGLLSVAATTYIKYRLTGGANPLAATGA